MNSEGRAVRLGPYTADVDTGELCEGDRRIPLRPQTSRLLALLARTPGTVIPRAAIRAALWDDHVLDHEGGINACARELRRALGDHAFLIETVPRRGYRLIPSRGAGDAEPTGARRAPLSRRLLAAAACVAFGLLAVAGVHNATTGPPTVLVLTPVPGTPDPIVAAFERLIAEVRQDSVTGSVRIVSMRPGDVYDGSLGALRRGETRIEPDLLIELGGEPTSAAFSVYFYRPPQGPMLWMERVPSDSVSSTAPAVARSIRSAT